MLRALARRAASIRNRSSMWWSFGLAWPVCTMKTSRPRTFASYFTSMAPSEKVLSRTGSVGCARVAPIASVNPGWDRPPTRIRRSSPLVSWLRGVIVIGDQSTPAQPRTCVSPTWPALMVRAPWCGAVRGRRGRRCAARTRMRGVGAMHRPETSRTRLPRPAATRGPRG